MVREELARKIARSTNKCSTSTSTVAETETENEDEESGAGNIGGFKKGDFVRSTFSDGVDYEAKIIDIISDETCLIRYLGYNNEDHVYLCDLIPSWGDEYRKRFLENFDATENNGETEKVQPKFGKLKQQRKHSERPTSSTTTMIPPPPPLPPMLEDREDAEDLSAMLMSWYMSGYYTGLYQARAAYARK